MVCLPVDAKPCNSYSKAVASGESAVAVMIVCSNVVLFLLNICYVLEATHKKQTPQRHRITIAVDHQTFADSWRLLRLSHDLFDIRLVRTDSYITSDIDMVGFGSTTDLIESYYRSRTTPPDYLVAASKVNSGETRNDMAIVGHSNEIFHTLTAQKVGNGTIRASSDLKQELIVFGSSFQGDLLSMRCLLQTLPANASNTSASVNKEIRRNLPLAQRWLPCGKEFVGAFKSMHGSSRYTGAWCAHASVSNDSSLHIHRVEWHFCHAFADIDALFVAAYVPFAMAVADAQPSSKLARTLTRGSLQGAYKAIQQHEAHVLRTGGGRYESQWVVQESFQVDKRLNSIADSFLARFSVPENKIFVGIYGTTIQQAVERLATVHSLFAFFPISGHCDVHADLDLILTAHAAPAYKLLTGPGAAHLAALRHLQLNVTNSSTPFGHPLRWRMWMSQIGLGHHTLSLQQQPPPRQPMSHPKSPPQPHQQQVRVTHDTIPTPAQVKPYGTASGTVLHGRLLSLRCARHSAPVTKTANFPPNQVDENSAPPGWKEKPLVECGWDLTEAFQLMFAASNGFSGPFCASLTLAAGGDPVPKISSVSATVCDMTLSSDSLFISAFVPLAVALRSSSEVAALGKTGGQEHARSNYSSVAVNAHWYAARPAFQKIVAAEEGRLLQRE